MFSDQTEPWDYTVDSTPDPTYGIADTSDADLGNFLSRPIKIQSFAWITEATLFHRFNPWTDFFENPRILNRIANFNLLRCKLKVKIMLSGNSFHYGRAIVAYTPLHQYDDFTVTRTHTPEDVIAASQRPHIYLDPTLSQGGTITLPFLWHKNALNIVNEEWKYMGDMTVTLMQALKHANGAEDIVPISVFAWAEDVSLSIPTSNVPPTLGPQSGEIFTPQVADEYGTGPISKPAGVIAKVAGALKTAPIIGAYARATEMAASAASATANMFGYSRPVNLQDINPYKPTFFGNLANTNVPDTCQKLTLDAKQELTIDPRTMGLGSTDELTIQSIAQRESYLTSFAWLLSDPTESLLWNSEVSPVLWAKRLNEIHMPACCFAALPFAYWRGTMKFRFQVVASSFHKGRLKITYDPSYARTNEYNTNYTYVLDLAKERDFTVSIGWGHEQSMIQHRLPAYDDPPFSPTAITFPSEQYCNGVISVYVVNDLTTPNSITNNDIEVNVFVSAGDDFEVFEPDSSSIRDLSWFEPQTGEIFSPQSGESGTHPDEILTLRENEPMKIESTTTMAPMLSDCDNTNNVYFADPIVSFRQCLKRYNYHSVICPSYGSFSCFNVHACDFPYYRGYAPGAVHLTKIPVVGTPYNYAKMTLLNYLTPAFQTRRGAIRWKYFREGGDNEGSIMSVTRSVLPVYGYTQGLTQLKGFTSTYVERVRQIMSIFPHTWDGSTTTTTTHNPVIEVELPFFSPTRFFAAKNGDVTGSTLYVPPFSSFHILTTNWKAVEGDIALIHSYVSVGEDFTLGMFTGAPVAYSAPFDQEPAA